MLKLGDKTIGKLYVGDKPIYKAYWGDKLIYQAVKPVFLDYIEFDGASWIDTGYKPNSNSSVSVTYYPYPSNAFTCVFGTQDTTTTNRFYAVISLTPYRLQIQSANTSGFWGVSSTGLVKSANGTFTSTQQKVGLTIDNYNKQISIKSDELTKTFDMATYNSLLGTVDCQYNLLLGNRSTAGVLSTANAFKGKIHDFQIKENGVLIQDLRPCIDPKGTICMYDMVTKKYFYNQGTGTLTAGNVIKFVDYIETDGNSYINTEFNPNPLTTQLDIELMLLDDTTPAQAVFGCRGTYGVADGKSCNIFYNVNSTKNIRIDWSGSASTVVVNKDELISISCLGNKVIINETEHRGGTQKVDTYLTVPILLGNMYNATQVFGTGSKIRIYNCKINDNGVLARDLRPCIVASQACFYDMVTGKVFTNAGTGTLTYTE